MHYSFDFFQDMADKLEASSIRDIRERLGNILKKLFDVLKCTLRGVSKVLYLSIFLIVFDAMRYMQRYYADDSFDNKFVDGNIKEFWIDENKPPLTPLRNWELKDRFQIARSMKLSRSEGYRILYYTIPTLIALMLSLAIIFLDSQFTVVIIDWFLVLMAKFL